MKLRKIISGLMLFAVLLNSFAFAAADKNITKLSSEQYGNSKENDLFYEDFTSVSPGVLPSGYSISEEGIFTTEKNSVFGGKDKNCLVITDEEQNKQIALNKNLGTFSGKVGIETRLKFVKTGDYDFTVFDIDVYDSAGNLITEGYIPSSGVGYVIRDASQKVNNVATHNIRPDTWYSIKYNFDFNKGKMSASVINCENPSENSEIKNLSLRTSGASDLASVKFISANNVGKWVIDYIRVYKGNENLEDGGPKGHTPTFVDTPVSHAIEGKLNVKINGRYKYLAVPAELSGKTVMTELKSLANILGMKYIKDKKEYKLINDKITLSFSLDGTVAKNGNDVMDLSEVCQIKDGRIFLPLSDIASALGFEYSFDSEKNEAVLNSTN